MRLRETGRKKKKKMEKQRNERPVPSHHSVPQIRVSSTSSPSRVFFCTHLSCNWRITNSWSCPSHWRSCENRNPKCSQPMASHWGWTSHHPCAQDVEIDRDKTLMISPQQWVKSSCPDSRGCALWSELCWLYQQGDCGGAERTAPVRLMEARVPPLLLPTDSPPSHRRTDWLTTRQVFVSAHWWSSSSFSFSFSSSSSCCSHTFPFCHQHHAREKNIHRSAGIFFDNSQIRQVHTKPLSEEGEWGERPNCLLLTAEPAPLSRQMEHAQCGGACICCRKRCQLLQLGLLKWSSLSFNGAFRELGSVSGCNTQE